MSVGTMGRALVIMVLLATTVVSIGKYPFGATSRPMSDSESVSDKTPFIVEANEKSSSRTRYHYMLLVRQEAK